MRRKVHVPGAADLGLAEATAPTACSAEDAEDAIGLVEERSGVERRGGGDARGGERFIRPRCRLGEGSAGEEARRGRRRARGDATSCCSCSSFSATRWPGGALGGVEGGRPCAGSMHRGGVGPACTARAAETSGEGSTAACVDRVQVWGLRASVPSTVDSLRPPLLFWMDLIRSRGLAQ